MFRRRTTNSADPETVGTGENPLDPVLGKGRPTPKRSEAEAARKKRMTPPKDRREAAARQRQRMRADREKMRAAMEGKADDRYLPKRDRGPVRHFCRDLVDSRRSAAEFLLPALVLILVLSAIPTPWAAGSTVLLWMMTILLTAADTVFLIWRVGRELRVRFPETSTKGARLYTVMRSTQIRFLRMPKPRVKPGAALPSRY